MADDPWPDIKRIVVHCSATPPEMDIGAAVIDQWHRERRPKPFRMIGYSDVIRRCGLIEPGRRPYGVELAHAVGFNSNAIAPCLVGGVNANNEPEANFTKAQGLSLQAYLHALSSVYPQAEICGHRDLPGAAKACPSFDVKLFLETGYFLEANAVAVNARG